MDLVNKPQNTQDQRLNLSKELLEKVWARDYYTCVYCEKTLLHPDIVRQLESNQPNNKVSQLDNNNQTYQVHQARLHVATHDHLIPFSLVQSLESNIYNLYSCCMACNHAKAASTNYQRWTPKQITQPWTSLNIGDTTVDYTEMLKMIK